MQAGDLLMDQLAIDEAAGLYRLGLSVIDGMEPTPAATQCELLVRLGTALAQNDRVSGLDILFAAARTALDLGRVDIVADATWAMRPINWLLGYDPAVLTLVQQALGLIDPGAVAARARSTCVLALHAEGLEDPERRHELITRAIDLGRETGQPQLVAQVLMCHWLATFHPDTLDDRQAVADELLTIAQREQLPFVEIAAHGTRCGCLLERGDLRAAATEANAVERIVGSRPDTSTRANILFRRAGIQFVRGELEAAETTADDYFALTWEMGQTRRDRTLMHGIHYMNVRLAQGRYDELLAGVRAATARYPDLVGVQAVLAMVLARSGRCEEARTILARLLARGATAIPPEGGWYATVTALGDAAHVINDTMFAARPRRGDRAIRRPVRRAERCRKRPDRRDPRRACAHVERASALRSNRRHRREARRAPASHHLQSSGPRDRSCRPPSNGPQRRRQSCPPRSAPDCRTDRRPTHHPRRSTAEPNVGIPRWGGHLTQAGRPGKESIHHGRFTPAVVAGVRAGRGSWCALGAAHSGP